MDERDRLLNVLARMVGICGVSRWPAIEVVVDDDETRTYPLTEDEAAVVAYGRRVLHEFGREPIPLMRMGS